MSDRHAIVHDKVSAWIASRPATASTMGWSRIADEHGAASWPALGALAGLVREAWGFAFRVQITFDGADLRDSAVIITDAVGLCFASRGRADEVLVAALGSAPARGVLEERNGRADRRVSAT